MENYLDAMTTPNCTMWQDLLELAEQKGSETKIRCLKHTERSQKKEMEWSRHRLPLSLCLSLSLSVSPSHPPPYSYISLPGRWCGCNDQSWVCAWKQEDRSLCSIKHIQSRRGPEWVTPMRSQLGDTIAVMLVEGGGYLHLKKLFLALCIHK